MKILVGLISKIEALHQKTHVKINDLEGELRFGMLYFQVLSAIFS